MAVDAQQRNQRSFFSFVRQIKPPKLGELREPISFYSSERVPIKNIDGTEGYHFDELVRPYFNCWAKVYQFQGNYLNDENQESLLSHIFLIRRDPEIKIEQRCRIVWSGTVYLVRGVRSVEDIQKTYNDGYKYLLILCDEFENFAKEERVVLDSSAEDDGSSNSTADLENPIWR